MISRDGLRHRKPGLRRISGLGAALVLFTVGLVLVPVKHASAAPPPINVTKSGPATTTAGSTVSYTLAASNPSSGVDQYDVAFQDQLPPGVTYVGGSTSPADVGDPTIIAQPDGSQLLLWEDAFDLPAGGADSVTFQVTFDPVLYPVDSQFTDTATGFSSSDPRDGPQFADDGSVIPDPSVTQSAPSSVTTQVTALKVTKDEPSPEAKLLRGVHDHPTVYTLTVVGGDAASTDDTEVTDFIPAAMEFLGCGGVDNSAGPEYPGAASLAATPAVGANCPAPSSVDTVSSPAGLPAGVYTKVTWDVGTLSAGETVIIRYAAGVPLRANTLTFPGGAPTPDSLGQTANLDNNIGPSTRQNGPAVALTNHVDVTGNYTGAVSPGGSTAVNVSTAHTVTINDLRVVKSVSPGDFRAGQIATYTLSIDASEYVDASDIVETDTMPNGLCPLGTTTNYVTGSPADCAPTGPGPSVPYQSVVQNANGTFTIVFNPISLAHNATTTITYQARMRTTYTGGSLAGEPTAEGDSFTNHVTETASTDPRTDIDTGESGTASVTDGSSATLTSAGGTFTKELQPRAVPQDCSADTYAPSTSLTPGQDTFTKGDRICFELTVGFPAFNATVNPRVADYLPSNLTYVAGSATLGPANTLPDAQVVFTQPNGGLVWTLGAPTANGTRLVAADAVFQVRLAAIVSKAAPGKLPITYPNISKAAAQNSSGVIRAFRANANFRVDPAPGVAIVKGVQSINGLPAAGNSPGLDHQPVAEGDTVVFRVDVTNPPLSPSAVQSVQTWDVLAEGIRCSDISVISDGGVCTNPGNANQPSFADAATRSAIVWNRPATEVIEPGDSVTYTYAMTIPNGTSVDADLVDTASVRSFDTLTNIPGTARFYPANNVDTSVPAANQDAPAASDSSDVFLNPVQVTKTVVSAINEAGNVGGEPAPGTGSTQATIGEQVTFTIATTIPQHATVYNGTLSDSLPAGLTLLSATASGLPAGSTFDSATGSVVLPAVVDDTSDAPIVFDVTVVARVTTDATNIAGTTRTNTATFSSNRVADGSAVTPRTGSADVVIVEPGPSVAKAANPTTVSGGQTVTYTLTAKNAAAASVLHDAWQVDCLPAGLNFVAYRTPSQGSTVPAIPGAGSPCASGTTQLAWNVGDLAPGATATLAYTATVTPNATGLQKFTNNTTLTGNSLAGTRSGPTSPGNANGRLYPVKAQRTITVLGASLTKTASPTIDTIGQTVSYTLTYLLNANVSYFNLTAVDTLPSGLDPNSLALVSQACVNHDGTACALSLGTVLPSVASGSATKIGLNFGNVAGVSQDRIVTVVYSVRVANVAAAAAGVTLTNSAHLAWDNTAKAPPANAGTTFDQVSSSASAPITVVEPSLTITKTVDDTTVEPGQTFTYSLHVTNANTATTSAAYNATVTDTVPPGVVTIPASITGGGVLSGTDINGAGGTITWHIPGPINPGDSMPLTYSARLGPSGTLTTAQQRNAAKVTGYDSLPSGGRHYGASPSVVAPVTPLFPSVQATKTTPLGNRAYIGEPFTWKITLTNLGGATAHQVGATDTLPPNWTYDNDSALVSVAGGPSQQIDPSIDTGTNQLTWSGLGSLASGASVTITYTATPTSDVATTPGVGLSVDQTNTVVPSALDATGASRNASAAYAGPQAAANAHIAASDVSLVKTATVAPIAGGRAGEFTITVTNNGPDPAVGVQVTDGFDLPTPVGVSAIDESGSGWSCTGAPIVCTRSDSTEAPLAAGASYPPITISYHVADDVADGTVIANSASVTSRTFDTDLTNNTDDATSTVGTEADLAIAKDRTSPSLIAGEPATYAISITNLGPSVSSGPFTVTDTLPPQSTFTAVSGIGWVCVPVSPGTVGATLTCTHPRTLAVGATTKDLVVTVGIPSGQTAAVLNTVAISDTTTPDPNSSNDTASVTDHPEISADLQIQKEHQGTFVAGADATYKFTVINHGPSDAANARITDTLPDGMTYVSSSGSSWTCGATGQDLTCTHSSPLVVTATSVVLVTVHLDPTIGMPVINTGTVSSTTPDPDLTNNTDMDQTDVNQSADLAIAKSHTDVAVAGSTLDYTLHVTNAGPSNVSGAVTVTDPLPAGLTYQSATGNGWVCGYAPARRLVTCTLAAGLTAGSAADDITLTVGIDPDAGPATLVNPADVTSATDDPDLTNNHAEDPTSVTVDAAVAIEKTLQTATPVQAGTDVTFALVASNSGPSDAAHVVVSDPLPRYLSYVSADGDGWTCVHTGDTVICSRPAVEASPPGDATPPITVVAHVDPSVPFDPPDGQVVLANVATVDMASPGTVGPPSEADVPVVARADLTLTKQPSTPKPVSGKSFTWTLAAHNDGPSDAAGPLTLTDQLPAYETYLSSAPPWTCTTDGIPATPQDRQTVTCTLTSGLATGTDAPLLQLLVSLSADAPSGQVVNAADVSSPTPGAAGHAQGEITVERDAELTITKSHSGNGAVGRPVDFRITVGNSGPSTADQIVVSDPLPKGLTYIAAIGDGWTCSSKGRDVTCRLAGVLAVGTQAPPISLMARVEASAYPSVTNVATVFSTDPDLSSRDSASDVLSVDPDATLGLTKRHQGVVRVGEQATYLLTVTNNGPTATPGPITIRDPLPAGLTYIAGTGPSWTCGARGATVTCIRAGELAAGASSTVTLVVLVGRAAAPSVVNTATASASGAVSVSASDTASVPVPPGSASVLPFTGLAVADLLLVAAGLIAFGFSLSRIGRRRAERR